MADDISAVAVSGSQVTHEALKPGLNDVTLPMPVQKEKVLRPSPLGCRSTPRASGAITGDRIGSSQSISKRTEPSGRAATICDVFFSASFQVTSARLPSTP